MRLSICFVATLLAIPFATAKAACLDVSEGSPPVTLIGNLTKQVFPGPPNYESVTNGDMPEQAWILKLGAPICIDDKGAQADPTLQFDTIHIYFTRESINAQFPRFVGARVRVTGDGFAAHSGHHHAPLVVDLTQISKL